MNPDQTTTSMPGGGYVLAESGVRVSVKSIEIVPDDLPSFLYEEGDPGLRFLLSWPKDKGWGMIEHNLRLSEFLWLVYGEEWREVVAQAVKESNPPEEVP